MKKIGAIFLLAIAITNGSSATQKTKSQKIVTKTILKINKNENVIIYPGASEVLVNAQQAIIIDYNTGKVLLEKNADERMAPSSMTKMMTAHLLEEAILLGKISHETQFKVSEKAWRAEGSRMFVNVNELVKVADLHKGIAIQSGNDASRVVAENLMGTEEGFALEMTRKAKELGMANTNFKNASGLPAFDHYSTARDLSKLAQTSIRDHGQFYHINNIKEFTYNGIKQGNRNPLLYDDPSCDGIKTGHTDAAGYGIAASCLEGPNSLQRYILVINGLPSMQARANEARKLMGWARANFTSIKLLKKGDVIEKQAKVILGVKESIPLVASEDLTMFVLRAEQNQIKVTHAITTTLRAPIKEGDTFGVVTAALGQNKNEVLLLANESVEKLGWFKRIIFWLKNYIT
jgi:D-alanyl-D-alanine carboxypeptidase (penicillin-binding protein 5/6)